MSSTTRYMIVIMDNASDSYSYGVYQDEDGKAKVFSSLDNAKKELESMAENYDEFLPTAYGKAFPYDTVTFEIQLENEGFAPWGWGWVTEDDEDEVQKICIGLLKFSVE